MRIEQQIKSIMCQHFGVQYRSTKVGFFAGGTNKEIYKVTQQKGEPLLVVALPQEGDYDLHGEYKKLETLFGAVPIFFPEPFFYVEHRSLRMFGMQYFPHSPLDNYSFRHGRRSQLRNDVSSEIGRVLGYTFGRTRMYSTAPHEGNVLLKVQRGGIDIKLVDADHFEEGTIDDLTEAVRRELVWLNYSRFKQWLEEGLDEAI